MDDEQRVLRHAIWLLEQALMEEEEVEIMAAEVIGRMGGRIMGMLEDEDDEGENWEKIQVDIDGIRYMVLLETLANCMVDTGRIQRVRKRLNVPLLTTLWILANPDTFRSVALHFGITPGVVHENDTILIECFREMRAMYIKWPDAAERRHIKTQFEAYCGLPGIVGAIDGTHNVVSAPSHQADRFRNRYKSHSYNTMAVCDHNLLIRDLHVGEEGSLHDSRVFRRSPLYRKLLEDENEELLEYDEHIIGDKAYTLMDCVMVPFKNRGNLNEQQRAFNQSLCRARVRIEHAFGKAFGQ
ncbi:Protein ANTAGONIST OF LIKE HETEROCHROMATIN PROTEIN 1 [Frankliniella fusca]|uniref:Protein ANTAGONIST OF LIKE HETEROCHROMATIN PROTEIN 1 n=1 Tax=Frankliniella fusca TaxID=407009 RepID=A0AAE1I2F2_9NEOP|nr:Protein ANTAGONIST OF LIKE HETEROCHROMATIN PROTEIN 1 [Frankliniella fusca]